MAESVQHPTLGLGAGRDLRVVGLNASLGSMLSVESACDSPPCPSPLCALSLSLSL